MKMLLFICGIADKIDGGLRKEEKYAEKKRFYFVWLSSPKRSNRPISPGVFKSVSRRNGMDYGGGLSSENRSLFGLRLLRTQRRMR